MLLQAAALNLALEDEEDLPQCTWDDRARWLPEASTDVVNPETERACDTDDEANGF